MLPVPGSACRMSAAIGNDLADGMLYDHLRGDATNFPYALYYLAPPNDDGWGIGRYAEFGTLPSIDRGEPMAQNDPAFTATVEAVNASEPAITLAHVRKGTSGCDNVPDPHPFYRDKIGKRWLFMHNGGVSKTRMTTLLGDYLAANPPNGSDIPACEAGVVDSELYFLFVLKKIEEKGWNVPAGIAAAVRAMVAAGETGAINLILSDGEALWAFRRGTTSHPLNYRYDSTIGYSAVASQYPSAARGSWVEMANYQLVILTRDAAPVLVNDVRNFCPGDIPADFNGDGQVNATDVAAFALNFGRSGTGNLDTDGDVDGADLAALIAAYGRTCP
jgi:predicted glutamine amidotransferase